MNYTHHELERISYITGNGLAPIYEEACRVEAMEESASDADGYIQEAIGSMPDEDFLSDIIAECESMSNFRVTKAALKEIVAQLEELQSQIARSSEYGLEQLNKARSLL